MDTAIDIALKFAAITVAFVVVLLIVAYTVLAERRVLGLIQGALVQTAWATAACCNRSQTC